MDTPIFKKLISAVLFGIIFNSPAGAQTTFGALSNFDVFNDTGQECHGFQIELEDVSSRDVGYVFGAPYERYGDPSILDITLANGHPGVIVRYQSAFDSATQKFVETTTLAPSPITQTDGHSCWNGSGVFNYATSGCEHFGLSLNVNPTKTTYRWLVADPNVPGALQPFGTTASVPAVTLNVLPPPIVGQQPIVQAVVPAPAIENSFEFGEAQWVKVYKTEAPDDTNLEDLLTDDPKVPDGSEPVEVEVEWFLLQDSTSGNSGAAELVAEAQLGAGNKSVTRRYEFYRYIGLYDLETHEALCDNPNGVKPECLIPGGVVGDYLGAQMAAVNIDPHFSINSLLPDNTPVSLPKGTVAVAYPFRRLVLGGTEPYTVEVTSGNIPNGLVLESESGILSGTPLIEGNTSFQISAIDQAGITISGTFTLTVEANPEIQDLCPTDPDKTDPGICGCGVSDIDSDADGISDCNDLCPSDPEKSALGVCGCGVSDVDSDSDGVADCIDTCPSDSAKTQPEVCGCGVSDSDTNGNGIVDCVETARADLSLTSSTSPTLPKVGRSMKLLVQIKNAGPQTATNVKLVFEITGVTYTNLKLPSKCSLSGSQVICALGDFRKGKSAKLQLELKPTQGGILTWTASARSTTLDSNLTNQDTSASISVL